MSSLAEDDILLIAGVTISKSVSFTCTVSFLSKSKTGVAGVVLGEELASFALEARVPSLLLFRTRSEDKESFALKELERWVDVDGETEVLEGGRFVLLFVSLLTEDLEC